MYILISLSPLKSISNDAFKSQVVECLLAKEETFDGSEVVRLFVVVSSIGCGATEFGGTNTQGLIPAEGPFSKLARTDSKLSTCGIN